MAEGDHYCSNCSGHFDHKLRYSHTERWSRRENLGVDKDGVWLGIADVPHEMKLFYCSRECLDTHTEYLKSTMSPR